MTDDSRLCHVCGSRTASKAFCTSCGARRAAAAAAHAVSSVTPHPPPEPSGCPSCGSVLIAGKKFCGVCGTPTHVDGGSAGTPEFRPSPGPTAMPPAKQPAVRLSEPTAPLPPPPPTDLWRQQPSPQRRSRGRGRWVMLALVLVLLAGAGSAFLIVRPFDTGAPSPASAADDDSRDAVALGDGSATPEATDESAATDVPSATTSPASPSASPEPTTEPGAAPSVSCWDGSKAQTLALCTEPAGASGLRWVAPGFDFAGENCDMDPIRSPATRRRIYECPLDGTDRVHFNFSEFKANRWGRVYYKDRAGFAPYPDGGFLRWDYTSAGNEYKTALLYRAGPWGVTIYSDDANMRDEAAANLIRRLRPASQLRGTKD